MIRLVLSDIDGTILPFGQWYIDDATKAAIAALEAAGIIFAPASGRPVADIDKTFVEKSYSSTCVASDGMVVLHDGEIIVDKCLPNDELQAIADAVSSYGSVVLGICFNEQDDPRLPMDWHTVAANDAALETLKPHIKYVDSIPALDRIPDQRVYTTGMFGPMDDSSQEDIERIAAERTKTLHTMRSAPGFHDVCMRSWSKALGAEELVKKLEISDDEVVFFGDSMNDISLFERFANSFCAAGGAEAAKAAARWVIPDPQDGGAVSVLNALARYEGDLSAALAELGW